MTRPIIALKEQAVLDLKTRMSEAKTIIAFEYQGLTVYEVTELRKKLRESNSTMTVYKNNIAKRASEALGYNTFSEDFNGPKALVFNNVDVVAPAKVLCAYAKDHDKVVIKAGIVEGDYFDVQKIKELASTPSYETLLTMLASSMLAPLRDIAIGLNMYVEKQEENA